MKNTKDTQLKKKIIKWFEKIMRFDLNDDWYDRSDLEKLRIIDHQNDS